MPDRAVTDVNAELPARTRCVAEPACLPALLALLDGYCERHRVDAQTAHDLRLIVEEACVNVMTHAYPAGVPGPLTLQLEATLRSGRRLMQITIEDAGRPFDPLALPDPDQTGPLADLPIGGLGVHLIRHLSDSQSYRHDPLRGNILTIGKFLEPAGHR